MQSFAAPVTNVRSYWQRPFAAPPLFGDKSLACHADASDSYRMPGHMLNASCPCGFWADVSPGWSERTKQLYVVAYNEGHTELLTVPEGEAAERKLAVIENPFLRHTHRHLGEPGVGAAVAAIKHRCPRCGEESMHFEIMGHWD